MTNESSLWFMSSFSGNGGADCVVVAHNLVPTVTVSAAAFTAFIESVKR
ncbi:MULTISPECIES: DUF397 domain-containing protein [unclassified Streptomyces]